MPRAVHNLLIGSALLAIPLVAELQTANPTGVPGIGFDVLLYEPFDFAFVLFASIIFAILNAYLSRKAGKNPWVGAKFGILVSVAWFVIAFLAVSQLHLSLGGKL